jgi:hypothetical protein
MVKRLLVLVGMLPVMLVAAVPTFAQQQGPITATGVLAPTRAIPCVLANRRA